MNREQLRRAERVSEILRERREGTMTAAQEAQEWKRPRSLSTKPRVYTFTDEQFRIALASLDQQANG
jgi:hypothetical protein